MSFKSIKLILFWCLVLLATGSLVFLSRALLDLGLLYQVWLYLQFAIFLLILAQRFNLAVFALFLSQGAIIGEVIYANRSIGSLLSILWINLLYMLMFILSVKIETYYDLILKNLERGRLFRARVLLLFTIIAHVKCPDNTIMYGFVLLERGKYLKAFQHLNKISKRNSNKRITIYLGLSCLYLERYAEAQEYFEKCINDDEFWKDANSGLFIASYLKGDLELCYRITRRGGERNRNDLQLIYYKGILKELEGNYDDAICYYERLTYESGYYNRAQKRADVLKNNLNNIKAAILGKRLEKRTGIKNRNLKEIIGEGNHPIAEWSDLEKKYWIMW